MLALILSSLISKIEKILYSTITEKKINTFIHCPNFNSYMKENVIVIRSSVLLANRTGWPIYVIGIPSIQSIDYTCLCRRDRIGIMDGLY